MARFRLTHFDGLNYNGFHYEKGAVVELPPEAAGSLQHGLAPVADDTPLTPGVPVGPEPVRPVNVHAEPLVTRQDLPNLTAEPAPAPAAPAPAPAEPTPTPEEAPAPEDEDAALLEQPLDIPDAPDLSTSGAKRGRKPRT